MCKELRSQQIFYHKTILISGCQKRLKGYHTWSHPNVTALSQPSDVPPPYNKGHMAPAGDMKSCKVSYS